MTKKKFSFVVVFFIIGIAGALFISSNAFKEAYRSRTIEKEVERLKKEAEKVQNENKQLADRIAYFETPEFQERVAKEKLNLQKNDETVVVVKEAAQQEEQKNENDFVVADENDSIPNYIKWWNFFFKY